MRPSELFSSPRLVRQRGNLPRGTVLCEGAQGPTRPDRARRDRRDLRHQLPDNPRPYRQGRVPPRHGAAFGLLSSLPPPWPSSGRFWVPAGPIRPPGSWSSEPSLSDCSKSAPALCRASRSWRSFLSRWAWRTSPFRRRRTRVCSSLSGSGDTRGRDGAVHASVFVGAPSREPPRWGRVSQEFGARWGTHSGAGSSGAVSPRAPPGCCCGEGRRHGRGQPSEAAQSGPAPLTAGAQLAVGRT